MSDAEDKLAAAATELKVLRDEYAVLVKRKTELEAELATVGTRLKQLRNPWGCNSGQIPDAERRVKLAELVVKDSASRQVVWKKEGYGHRGRTYVVTRVTPKRIYVREAGSGLREAQYDRDTGTTRWSGDGGIDLEKTFPEGIDEFAKQQKKGKK